MQPPMTTIEMKAEQPIKHCAVNWHRYPPSAREDRHGGAAKIRANLMVPYRRPELLLLIGTEVYNGPFGEALL
jgi:hypothetical protein